MAIEETAPVPAPNGSGAPEVRPELVSLTSTQLKERLDETREAATRALLKEFGFESKADGRKAMDALKKLQESQLSEQERLAKQLSEYEAKAKAGESYAKLFGDLINEQIAALPESVRKTIEDEAGDAQARYKLMTFLKKAGAIAAPMSAPEAPKAPASAGAAPPAPKPSPAKSKWDEFRDMEKRSPLMASVFYQTHAADIEASRPSQ